MFEGGVVTMFSPVDNQDGDSLKMRIFRRRTTGALRAGIL